MLINTKYCWVETTKLRTNQIEPRLINIPIISSRIKSIELIEFLLDFLFGNLWLTIKKKSKTTHAEPNKIKKFGVLKKPLNCTCTELVSTTLPCSLSKNITTNAATSQTIKLITILINLIVLGWLSIPLQNLSIIQTHRVSYIPHRLPRQFPRFFAAFGDNIFN